MDHLGWEQGDGAPQSNEPEEDVPSPPRAGLFRLEPFRRGGGAAGEIRLGVQGAPP